MKYRLNDIKSMQISPGTVGIAQRIFSDYEEKGIIEDIEETSELVFLTKNDVLTCKHNQY